MELKDTYNVRNTKVVWDNLKSLDKDVVREELLKLLEETVNVYSVHPEARSLFNNHICCYYDEHNGTFCAIGRVIPEDYIEHIVDDPDEEGFNTNMSVKSVLDKFLPDIPHYELVSSTLLDIQNLHDSSEYWHTVSWDKGKLTPKGIETYKKIKEYLC